MEQLQKHIANIEQKDCFQSKPMSIEESWVSIHLHFFGPLSNIKRFFQIKWPSSSNGKVSSSQIFGLCCSHRFCRLLLPDLWKMKGVSCWNFTVIWLLQIWLIYKNNPKTKTMWFVSPSCLGKYAVNMVVLFAIGSKNLWKVRINKPAVTMIDFLTFVEAQIHHFASWFGVPIDLERKHMSWLRGLRAFHFLDRSKDKNKSTGQIKWIEGTWFPKQTSDLWWVKPALSKHETWNMRRKNM